jgi:hypothetical protein
MKFSEALLVPFRYLGRPPVLETPMSTIPLPSSRFTTPLVIASFFACVGGFVYCYVDHSPMWDMRGQSRGQTARSWVARGDLSHQVIMEGIVISTILSMGGLSLVAIFTAMTRKKKDRTGLIYSLIYRFGFTLPIWAFLAFEVFRAKIPSYRFLFLPSRNDAYFSD